MASASPWCAPTRGTGISCTSPAVASSVREARLLPREQLRCALRAALGAQVLDHPLVSRNNRRTRRSAALAAGARHAERFALAGPAGDLEFLLRLLEPADSATVGDPTAMRNVRHEPPHNPDRLHSTRRLARQTAQTSRPLEHRCQRRGQIPPTTGQQVVLTKSFSGRRCHDKP